MYEGTGLNGRSSIRKVKLETGEVLPPARQDKRTIVLLERDGLVHTPAVRRGVGRPSHLYALTPAAEALFPRRYDRLLMDVYDQLVHK